jgi:hypothetical protein
MDSKTIKTMKTIRVTARMTRPDTRPGDFGRHAAVEVGACHNRKAPFAARLLPLLLLLILPATVRAEFEYMVANGTVTITKYTGPGGAVSIPSAIAELPVTSIGDDAFAFCTSLTSVVIGNSVTSIGNRALARCTSLTSVTIPSSVTSIGYWAFYGCTRLTSVTIPNSVTSLGGWAFYGCTGLTNVTIGNSVTSLGWEAFSGCASLTSVAIPNSVTSIEGGAFSGCTSLTSVGIPNSVTSIGYRAFYGCAGLATITIGKSVTSIGQEAFWGCSRLTGVTIPESVTGIGMSAFAGCGGLADVTLGNSVTSIEGGAFSGCTSLTSVTIPNSVTNVGSGAFSGCSRLTVIEVAAQNPAYSSLEGVLLNKTQTMLLRCPEGKAGSYVVPNSVTNIDDSAFYDCTRLTSVAIPNSVTSLGRWAFHGCTGLTNVTIGNSVTSLGWEAFSGCASLTSVTIPNSVTSLGGWAFYGCIGLASVAIPNSVTNIDDTALWGCTSLTAIEVAALNPAYSSLEGVLFDKTQTTLLRCPEGKAGSYVVPNSVTYIYDSAFYDCIELTAIEVDALNPNYSSLEGVLFDKTQTTLIQCPGGRAGRYTVPTSVTIIEDSAFSGCINLTGVTIGNSVTRIGEYAFSGCDSLSRVTIGNGVTGISEGAFARCTNLISITVGNSLDWIVVDAFYGCTRLAGVYFAGNAPDYDHEYDVFEECPEAIVYYRPGTTGWGEAFDGRPTALWRTPPSYPEWVQTTALPTQYPQASAESDDPDRDGLANEMEMLAGTDPADRDSALILERVPRPNDLNAEDQTAIGTNQHALYIRSVPGKSYGVQSADDLGGPWRTSGVVTATSTQKRLVFPKPGMRGFYRVVLAQ